MSHPRSVFLLGVALLLALPACRRPPEASSVVRLGDVFHAGRAAQPAPAAAAPKARVEWRFDAPAREDSPPNQGWVAVTGVEGLAVREGRLVGRATTTLPVLHVSHAVGGDPDTLHEVQVRMRASAGRNLAVAFLPDEKPDLETYLRIVQADPADGSTPIVAGEEMRTYSFKRPESFAASEIRHVALRPTDAEGARFEIESIRLVFRKEHLAGIPSGLSWQGLSGVYRETLVARAPEALALEVTLPKRPWLDLALGTISEEAATFEVNVDAGRGKQRLLTRTLTTPHRWESLALDLGAFAGRTVKLELRLASPYPGTLGFWGSSVVRNRSLPHAAGAAPPRGVIVIWADTLRRDHLDVYGYGRPTAPALRELAAEGVLFKNCVSQATWTKVSTPSLMTSLYPSSHGVRTWDDRLSASARTLAEVYRDAGYATWSFASNGFTGEMTNLHQGFEEVHEAGSLPDRRSSKTARIGMDRLFPWLEAHRDGPFFAFLSLLDPHDPFKPNPPYDTLWADPRREKEHERQTEAARKHIANPILRLFGMPGREEMLKGGVDPEAYVAHNIDWYDGSIRGMDAELGRLRERLRGLGLERDVLVVFISDHGEEFLEHGWTFHGQSTYGELSMVPLVLWGPGYLAQGRVVEDTVSTIDVMPTLLAFAGLGHDGMQGQSLAPLVAREPRAEAWSAQPAVIERLAARDDVPPLDGEAFAVLVDDWKLIHNTKRREPRPEFELFRFREDPLDLKNVAAQHPEVVARLARQLDAWKKLADAGRLKPDALSTRTLGAEELERLRALGYVQ